MDITSEMHEAARTYFAALVEGGATPKVAVSGSLRGLRYFPTKIGDAPVWLSAKGLVNSTVELGQKPS